VDGESVTIRCPKHLAALKGTTCADKAKGKRKKGKAPPDIPPPVLNETNPSSSATTFPVGWCCLGDRSIIIIIIILITIIIIVIVIVVMIIKIIIIHDPRREASHVT
jgi:hypothetical protein